MRLRADVERLTRKHDHASLPVETAPSMPTLLKRARNLLIDAKNFLHPTTVWRDSDLMERNIDSLLRDLSSSDETSDRIDWKARAEAAEYLLNHNTRLANAIAHKATAHRSTEGLVFDGADDIRRNVAPILGTNKVISDEKLKLLIRMETESDYHRAFVELWERRGSPEEPDGCRRVDPAESAHVIGALKDALDRTSPEKASELTEEERIAGKHAGLIGDK